MESIRKAKKVADLSRSQAGKTDSIDWLRACSSDKKSAAHHILSDAGLLGRTMPEHQDEGEGMGVSADFFQVVSDALRLADGQAIDYEAQAMKK